MDKSNITGKFYFQWAQFLSALNKTWFICSTHSALISAKYLKTFGRDLVWVLNIRFPKVWAAFYKLVFRVGPSNGA